MNITGYGVKLGNSNLSIQRWHASRIYPVLIDEKPNTPSCIYYAGSGALPIFGTNAKNRLISRPNEVYLPSDYVNLTHIAESFCQHIGFDDRSYITVTTNFNDPLFDAKFVAELKTNFGFTTINVINDAIAAVHAYDLCTPMAPNSTCLVVNLGSVMSVTKVVIKNSYPVLSDSVRVDVDLDDLLDDAVREQLSKEFWEQHGDRFNLAIEYLKHEAARNGSAQYYAGFISPDCDETIVLPKANFDDIVSVVAEHLIIALRQLLQQTRTAFPEITHIIFCGGHYNIKAFPKAIQDFFAGFNITYLDTIDPMLVAAIGAAKHCGSIISQQTDSVICENYLIAPSSIGIKISGDVFDVLIPQNIALPKTVARAFKTERNNQDEMYFKIYEGTRPLVEHNNHLGNLSLPGLPLCPAGGVSVLLTMVLDRDGLLRITASLDTLSKSLTINYHLKRVDPTMKRVMQIEARTNQEADKAEVYRRKLLVEYKGVVEKAQHYLSEHPSLPPSTSTCLAAQCRAAHHWILKNDNATSGLISKEHQKFAKFCEDVHVPCTRFN